METWGDLRVDEIALEHDDELVAAARRPRQRAQTRVGERRTARTLAVPHDDRVRDRVVQEVDAVTPQLPRAHLHGALFVLERAADEREETNSLATLIVRVDDGHARVEECQESCRLEALRHAHGRAPRHVQVAHEQSARALQVVQ